MKRLVALALLAIAGGPGVALAQKRVPPYDLWTPEVLARIRDRSTLNLSITPQLLYSDISFTSNASASWFDASPPYEEHQGEPIRIHAFVATPVFGNGPFPAVVIGHGHGGRANRDLTVGIANLGYVAIFLDGPSAGESTGGPQDEEQAWISVDKGPQYSYLFHYAYAGMRAVTVLEELAARPGNPFKIDTSRIAVMGASMGGILSTYLNGIDERIKAAIVIASAGNWQHTLRYPNSWLYHGIYGHTRDVPYNGQDPLNSIENIDSDPTAIAFINYFDPIRYARTQHGPVLTVIGSHDQYFPLPNANLMQQAIGSAGSQAGFEKRLWILPNTRHSLDISVGAIATLASGLQQWLDFAFGARGKPLPTPQISLTPGADGRLRFDVTLGDPPSSLADVRAATLHVATRIDSTVATIQDFSLFTQPVLQGERLIFQVPAGFETNEGVVLNADNAIYFVTLVDSGGLPVSSLVYKGGLPMDLSSGFIPNLEPFELDVTAPAPPERADAARDHVASAPVVSDTGYQGFALSNPVVESDDPIAVRVEALTANGRIAAAEGLINPIFISLPPAAQQIFVAQEWFGPGARNVDGAFRLSWSDARAASLEFRGDVRPSQLDEIGPVNPSSTPLFLAFAPEQAPPGTRRMRITSDSENQADVTIRFFNKFGAEIGAQAVRVAAHGTAQIPVDLGSGSNEKAYARLESAAIISARMEVAAGDNDPWSIPALPLTAAARLIQPHVEWNGIFTTRLFLLNASGENRAVQFQLHSTAGPPVAPGVVQLMQKDATATFTIESLFGAALGGQRGAGWLELDTGGGVLVFALAVNPATGAAAASQLQPAEGLSWSMPFYVENVGYFTGLALANAGPSPANVTITAYDPAGSILGQTRPVLAPLQSATQLVSQWLLGLQSETTGQIVIEASAPLSLLAYFGTDDGAALAAIPFTPRPR
jgi:cephalosporin-C deacetylase-like acetyl esterase